MSSGIWWKGALKAAAWNLASGLAIGLVAAAAIYLVVPPLAATFAVESAMAGVVSFVAPAGTFNPLPLMAFNSLISSAIGLFTGGGQAIAEHEQRQLNIKNVEMLRELGSHAGA